MAERRAWTIGAAADCDVVVDESTVSSRHCRLSKNDEGYLLEDFGSTNGTFVNGARLTTPIAVTPDDEITLGPTARLPWEAIVPDSQSPALHRRVIRIGRLPDNDVVLDYPNVSGHHARIVVENGRATIEDLGSTNGVAIGNPDSRITAAAPLAESDTVYFGTTGVSAAELLNPEGASPPGIQLRRRVPSVEDGLRRPLGSQRPIIIACVSVAAVLVMAVAAISFFGPDEGGNGSTADGTNGASDETSGGDSDGSTSPAIAARPADAVYSVFVQQAGVDAPLQVGTAWAVSRHQLVTSGVVAWYLEKYAGDIEGAQVRCDPLEKVFVVTGSVVHPEFKQAEAAAGKADQRVGQIRQKLLELQSATQAPSDEELTRLENQFVEANWDRFLAGERMAFFDVGLLRVDGSFPFALEVEKPSRKPAVQTKLKTYGFPFDPETMSFEPAQRPSILEGRLLRLASPLEQPASNLRRMVVGSPAGHHEGHEWRGSPVLAAEGRVVGIYVRPSLPVDPQEPVTGESFDAVPVERLNDLPVE